MFISMSFIALAVGIIVYLNIKTSNQEKLLYATKKELEFLNFLFDIRDKLSKVSVEYDLDRFSKENSLSRSGNPSDLIVILDALTSNLDSSDKLNALKFTMIPDLDLLEGKQVKNYKNLINSLK